MRFQVNRKEKAVVAGLIALTMSGGGFAFGASVNNVNSEQEIYACVTGVNGNITKVSNAPHACPKGTTPLSWNVVGPKGDQGVQGLKGDTGDKGDTGAPGATYGAYITNNKNEHVADVVSFDPLTGVATIRVDKGYWKFSEQDGLSPITSIHLARPDGQFTLWKYYKSSDCSGSYLVGNQLADANNPYNVSLPLYDGLTFFDLSGYVQNPAIVKRTQYLLKDMHSIYRNDPYWPYHMNCATDLQFSGTSKMFELETHPQYLPDLGDSPRIVSTGDN